MKKIEHEIKINADLLDVFQALTTLDGLESWHSAHIAGDFNLHGQFTIQHEEHPSFVWKITRLEPQRSVQWQCIEGPGNAPGTQVEFDLMPENEGSIVVKCIHSGWSDNNENFNKCNTLWGMLLGHLKDYIETGKARPTFN